MAGLRFSSSVVIQSRFVAAEAAVLGALGASLRATADDIVTGARERAPYDADNPHDEAGDIGHLRDNIAQEVQGPLHTVVHSTAPYSAYPEYGTVHMAAQPYFIPAIQFAWPFALYRHWAAEMARVEAAALATGVI